MSSYEPDTDDLGETQSDSGSESPELHENAYSQTAAATSGPAPVDERLLTGRYSTNQSDLGVQEPLPENLKDVAALFDWNEKFQDAVERSEGPEKYRLLSSTARDFGKLTLQLVCTFT